MLRFFKLFYFLIIILFLASCESGSSIYDDGEFDSTFMSGENGDPNGNGNTYEPGTITAGEWNDIDNWFFWKDLIQGNEYSSMQSYWGFSTTERYTFVVTNNTSEPVVNATVILEDSEGDQIWKTLTDNTGYAHLYSSLYEQNNTPLKVRIIYGDHETVTGDFTVYDYGGNHISIPIGTSIPEKIDIQFVVDATGSMSDEINYLKAELGDVLTTIQEEFSNIDINVGSVFYRDEGDEYVIDKLPFTSDISSLISFVNNHNADGGGDFPEAVHTAINAAINDQWRTNSISGIMFLLLDAPPHYESQVISDIQESIRIAAEKGIKIIPITASGIDKETEFLMRFMAISTNGTYCFITNHSGVGNDHIEPTVGQYEIEYLNDLIIRLITENTAY